MANISPGVYTKIIDLSAYIQAVPSTIGLLCGYSRQGRDNELVFVGSRSEFISEWGEPDINDFGKNYGQGPYIAYNHLGESGSLYWMRVLPDDAAYSHLRINGKLATADATATIWVDYDQTDDSFQTMNELLTGLQSDPPGVSDPDQDPICILYPIGRGDYYNKIGVRITEHSNPTLDGVYVLDIYEKQSDGEEVIIESFDISFDPGAVDNAGDSIWITYVLETYSSILRAAMYLANGDETEGYKTFIKTYDKEIGTVSVTLTSGSAQITDNKQVFSDWETSPETGNASYVVIAKDARGNEIWGWLGASSGDDDQTINVFQERMLTGATQGWNGSTSAFDTASTISYLIKKSNANMADPFTSSEPVPLKKGSEGSLRKADGSLNTDPITALNTFNLETGLEQAYSGLLLNPKATIGSDTIYADEILDTENYYFNLVYDAGYPADVKTAITTLCTTRRDCVGILDNGDNTTVNNALSTRTNTNNFNTFYVALYEPFTKVSDPFTGEDIWFSPIFHMSYIIPRNDNVAEPWFAAAGFTRAAINNIKELRYNPRLGQRDQLYLKQLNPIVKFAQGYVVWGQLTSQARASSLQDLNVVRLVLYCKRAIATYARGYIFEQNDPITWAQVSGQVTEFLENIKSKRGLEEYTVDVSATAYEKKRKTFHINILMTPIRPAEKIELNFFVK